MKIAIVCYPTFGGSGVVATELGMALASRGHQIHFVTYKQPVRLAYLNPNIHFHQVHVSEYPLFLYQTYELALSGKLVDIVKHYGIEVLHVHYAIPHAYATYMAKEVLKAEGISVKIVTTLHGTDITLVGNHPNYKPVVRFSINNSDVVTSVSQSLKEETIKQFGVDKDIKVIPNFIDNSKYPVKVTDCRREDIAEKGERVISHISNLRKVKRVEDVIKVFFEVQKRIECKLIIIGEGPEKESLESLCECFGILEKVFFLGNSDDVDKALCMSDLFLLPSEKESFGLVALEAMANGVPVVSSNIGGLPEVNIDDETGFLCDVGDVDTMVQKVLFLLENEEILTVFKKAARNRSKVFDTQLVVPKYEAIYRL